MPFACSICEEESTRICVRCTKDACDNHLCEKCRKCSDCCECEVKLSDTPVYAARTVHPEVIQEPPTAEPIEEPLEEAVAPVNPPHFPMPEANLEASPEPEPEASPENSPEAPENATEPTPDGSF